MKFMNLWKYYDNNQTQLIYPNVLNHIHEKEIAKTNPKWAFEFVKKYGKDEDLEPAIAKNAEYSYMYARFVLMKKPFPLGEPAIAKSAYFSILYADQIINGKFELGEKAIAESDYQSFTYARDILKGPFPLGEPVIAKSTEYSKKYTQEILKKDFILDGKLICNYEG